MHIRGGVAIYINQSFSCTINKLNLDYLCDEKNFEATGVVIDSLKLIIISLYRSPKGIINVFLEKLDILLNELRETRWMNYDIVVGGDLNADFDVTKHKRSVTELKNLLRQCNFHYVNDKPTRELACLDNIFVNFKTTDLSCNVTVFPFSDHNAVCLNYTSRFPQNKNNKTKYLPKFVITRPTTDDKIVSLRNSLAMRDWFGQCYADTHYALSDDLSAKATFDRFYKAFLTQFNDNIPIKKCKVVDKGGKTKLKNKQNPWYTKQLTDLKSKVMLLYNIYNRLKTDQARLAYVNCRNEYKKNILEAKKAHNLSSIERSTNKCKAAWKLINSVSKDTRKPQINISPQKFNDFFIKSVKEVGNSIIKPDISSSELLSRNISRSPTNTNMCTFSEVSPGLVLSIVRNMRCTDSIDIYDISCNLMKKVIDCIVVPLTYCINKCICEGYFPDELKISRVVPVYKKGDKDSPSSFRPISIVPAFSKVLEYIMFKQLSVYFEELGIISRAQYGFRKNLSTVDAIDSVVKYLLKVFEDKGFAHVTFCDLSKAFDSVDHTELLKKLDYYGIRQNSLNLLKSYLQDRKQVVCVDNVRSSMELVKVGVPQGSVLGPFLFLIMINDLPSCIKANTVLYADDTTFLHSSKDLKSLKVCVDETMRQASCWFRANGFLLNENKTQHMLFTLKDKLTSDGAGYVKFLGVYLDEKLCWGPHVKYISGKLSRVIYLLRRLMDNVPEMYVRISYFSFFQSIMSYGIILWGNSSYVNDILLLQKKAIRVITGSSYKAHCKPLFCEKKILTVINLYIYHVLIYTKKKLPEVKRREDVHSYNTRTNRGIYSTYHRLSKSCNSHELMGHKLFNKLPQTAQDLPEQVFKQTLYDWLIVNPFYDVNEFFNCHVIL